MTNSPEFAYLVEEFHSAKPGSYFSDFLIDHRPKWRELRYKLVLDSLRKAFPEKKGSVLEALHHKRKSSQKSYIHFIKTFRKAFRKGLEVPLLHKLATHLFLKIDYQEFALHLVNHMEKAGHAVKSSHKNFIENFDATWHGIASAPHSLKMPILAMMTQFLRGQFNIAFDPYCQENTPYHLFDTEKTTFIRMGTPTKEGLFACLTHSVAINEEFLAFLESYVMQNKRHLYINLQNRILGYPGYDESPRCEALEKLALHYPKNFLIVTLTKNSAFWQQAAPFVPLSGAHDFKKEFLAQLTHDKSGYHFSKESHITAALLKKLLEQVHEEFFASEPHLSLQQRKDFIEIFYTIVMDYLIDELKPDSVNITCKDGIDRAGTSSALYYVYDRLKNKVQLTDSDKAHLKAILFAPALLVKKRPPTYERFKRFQSAAGHLLNHYG